MKLLMTITADEAKQHFLKGSSYFNGDFPDYISFEPILNDVNKVLDGKGYAAFKRAKQKPNDFQGVNYSFVANKDGRFSWRPIELFHPAIYVSLVDLVCEPQNWAKITSRLTGFRNDVIDCCSSPVMSVDNQSDQASQIRSWWQRIEQRSLTYSLEFSHMLHTDVTNCYGSLYTHSIAWALHDLEEAKKERKKSLIGNKIDAHIQASRYGQTNGISQGSILMDFIAKIVLGYVDKEIADELDGESKDFHILRYRDDYRIFTNSDERAEKILMVISNKLRNVGMRLGVEKTLVSTNVVEGSIKPDKLAGIDLQDLGDANAETIQKQFLRLHAFGLRFRNSGALRRLLSEMYTSISSGQFAISDDLEVHVAIITDIAVVSPQAFPAIAGILSYLISRAQKDEKQKLWSKVLKKMRRVPYNGYLEIWLQRVVMPKAVGMNFESDEPICQIVNGEAPKLWENDWIANSELKTALDVKKILIGSALEKEEVLKPEEVEVFINNAWAY